MKIILFDKSKAPHQLFHALKNDSEVIDYTKVNSFNYEHLYHIKTCDFFINNGTFGSDHPKRNWLPNVENHKTAVMNHRNDIINMFARYYNKKIIWFESATISRMKCNYINKFYKEIPPRFYRMGLNHWVFSKTKWPTSQQGRLNSNLKIIEAENNIKFKNIENHQWKNNKNGFILILPGLEDDPTSSIPVDEFVRDNIKKIRKITDRKIVVKAHPHSKLEYKNIEEKDVTVVVGGNKIVDMQNDIYCAVLDSSTSIFELVNLGIPTITTKHSFGADLKNTDISKIENLHYATSDEVYLWMEKMAATEYLLNEIGDVEFILPKIKELLNE